MKSLGVVLARGSSKRLPRKNVLPLGGLPLVAWSCRAALASNLSHVILSTEDAEIASIGREQGIDVPFTRPAELADDFARDVDIVLHAVDTCQEKHGETYNIVVMIQATTPFVRPEHLNACIDRVERDGLACVFTARKVQEHPRWMWVEAENRVARPFMEGTMAAGEQHGQNLPDVYYPTGAAWAVRVEEMRRQDAVYCEPSGIVVMKRQYSVDVDTKEDLIIAEAIARELDVGPVSAAMSQDGDRQ